MTKAVYTLTPIKDLRAGDKVAGAGAAMWEVVTTPAVYTHPTLGRRYRFRMRRLDPWEDGPEGTQWETAADTSWQRLETPQAV